MFAAKEYLDEITQPTVSEFYAEATNPRRGMLACMSVLHVVDHVLQNREPDAKKANQLIISECDRMSDSNEAFAVVRGFSNASKHARLTNKLNPGFGSKDYLTPAAGGLSHGMTLDDSLLDDDSGDVVIKWKNRNENLTVALKNCIDYLKNEYQELQ